MMRGQYQSYCLKQVQLLVQVAQMMPKQYQSYCLSVHHLTLYFDAMFLLQLEMVHNKVVLEVSYHI